MSKPPTDKNGKPIFTKVNTYKHVNIWIIIAFSRYVVDKSYNLLFWPVKEQFERSLWKLKTKVISKKRYLTFASYIRSHK